MPESSLGWLRVFLLDQRRRRPLRRLAVVGSSKWAKPPLPSLEHVFPYLSFFWLGEDIWVFRISSPDILTYHEPFYFLPLFSFDVFMLYFNGGLMCSWIASSELISDLVCGFLQVVAIDQSVFDLSPRRIYESSKFP